MARPTKFPTEAIVAAASRAAREHWRDATIAHVADALGAPVGSIYHRFGSREELFATAWLEAIERFHVGLLEAATDHDPQEAALRCALHIPRFCRDHPDEAAAMTLYRQEDLARTVPPPLRERVEHVNDTTFAAYGDLARRRFGEADPWHVELIAIACGESPYGLVRRHLRADEPVPAWVDDVVRATSAAVLALGDR